ncbi:hypothetical protein FOZ61_008373 [Perkinsus olseni]|uniref:Uncharacterized protein n=1 Tax=Perkinsus olseni TaxID=32597 RepID=A0A7J6M878_PEROL|nr:hypothetical protein FOZ61_008373 [Perkinsus olseni]
MRVSVASTAASLSSEEDNEKAISEADEMTSQRSRPFHEAQAQPVSKEALIRTTVLRSNAVDFTLKYAETVDMLEKSLRLKKPTRRRSVCGATEKWTASNDIDLRSEEAQLWLGIQSDGTDYVD